MASWGDVRTEAPELADAVRARFAAHRHAVLGTLRRDGGPRLSGTETTFTDDGHLWLGSMDAARKVDDLRRDPRLALHSATADAELVGGDAKIAGRASEVTDEATRAAVVQGAPGPFVLFRVDVTEVVLVEVAGDHLVITSWHEGRGLTKVDRY
jgi:predicted pyridoxine 5'-phosphate oxidase superfamily flavin-nucleotide-binding protein